MKVVAGSVKLVGGKLLPRMRFRLGEVINGNGRFGIG